MLSRIGITFIATLLILTGSEVAVADEWALSGNWSESCCCQAACPCVFGSAPTKGHCEGSALFEIESGKYDDVQVDGLSAVITYRFGEWLRIYVDDAASNAQVDAVAKLLNQETTFGGLFAGADLLSVEKTPIEIKKSEDTIAFSVKDSSVELEAMKGPNGELVRIDNLSIPWFINGYEQFIAKSTTHKRGEKDFEYTGTNGATSYIDAAGTLE